MSLRRFAIVLLSIGSLMTSCIEPEDPIDPMPVVEVPSVTYIFTSDSNGKYDIWLHDNSEFTKLTSNDNKDSWWGRYNKEAKSILYYESDKGRNVNDYASASLMIMNADGTEAKELLPSGENGFEEQGLASWSNDGSQIIFSAKDSSGFWQLYLLELSSGNIQKIRTSSQQDYFDPIFSKDDQSIFYVTSHNNSSDVNSYEIFEMDLETEEETRITNNDTRDHHPVLTPNGSEIWFESLVDEEYLSIGKWQINKVELATNTETKAIETNNILLLPSFHEDGNRVFVTRLNLDQFSMEIMTYDITTENLSVLKSAGTNSMNVVPF